MTSISRQMNIGLWLQLLTAVLCVLGLWTMAELHMGGVRGGTGNNLSAILIDHIACLTKLCPQTHSVGNRYLIFNKRFNGAHSDVYTTHVTCDVS